MKKAYFFPLLLVFNLMALSFIGCKNEVGDLKEDMAFDTIVYLSQKRHVFDLTSSPRRYINLGNTPIINFVIADSVMFVDTERENGIIEIFSMKDYKSKGCLLNQGRSSGEFSQGINLGLYTTIVRKDQKLFATLFDMVTGKVYSLNVSEFLQNRKYNLLEIYRKKDLSEPAFWVKQLSDSVLFIKTLTSEETVQKRYLVKNGKAVIASNMDFANDFVVPKNEDFNLLSTLIATSPNGNLCAEAMVGMNYINVYSPLTGKGFTICCGDKIDKLSEIISLSKANRKYMFADIRAYAFGFAVLKYDITEREYQTGANFTPSILFFDWHGNLYGEVKPEVNFNHFDMDINEKKLYILSTKGRLIQFDMKKSNVFNFEKSKGNLRNKKTTSHKYPRHLQNKNDE